MPNRGTHKVLDDCKTWSTEFVTVPLLTCCTCSFVLNRSTELIAESTLALMLRRVRKKEWMSSDGLHLKHEIHEFLMFPNSVSTLRGSYGKCKGRCLIRVLTLLCGILPVSFCIKVLVKF